MIPADLSAKFWRQVRLVLRNPFTKEVVLDGIYPDLASIVAESAELLKLIPKPYRVSASVLANWPLLTNDQVLPASRYHNRTTFDPRCCLWCGYLSQSITFTTPVVTELVQTRPIKLSQDCLVKSQPAQLKTLLYKICIGDEGLDEDGLELSDRPENQNLYHKLVQLTAVMNPADSRQIVNQYQVLIKTDCNIMTILKAQGLLDYIF